MYVLPFKPRHCFCPFHSFQLYPDINTFLTTPIHADNVFCVTRVQPYNFLQVGCFAIFFIVHSVNNVLKVVMLLAKACLSVRISRTGNPKWFASQKASMAYIDVGMFYNKFLVEFSYAVEHNSPLFFFFIICQSYLDNRCHSCWYFCLFFRRYYCRFSGSISLLWRYRLCFSPDDKAMTL